MNKHRFSIIFSKARGIWIVARESASAFGQGHYAGTLRVGVARVLCAAPVLLGAARLDAQIAPAPGAAPENRPLIDAAANGRTLVQITTPSAAGVSNNVYSQFNVGSQGVIFNNARTTALTQLGGYVAGNPYLAQGGARIILNQVVGTAASQLLGYSEVAGQKADFVLANPNGISCNGAGFINSSRVVLTTGTPVLGTGGSLDAFRVVGGQIQVGSGGIDATTVDQLDLIARSVQVNGQIWANQQLNVIAGTNQVTYSDLGTQTIQGDANQPALGIDVALLGGMYANKIRLMGTEAGVGVNSQGTLAALNGDFTLTSQGQVVLAGSTTATHQIAVTAAGPITNGGTLYAQQNLNLTSQGQIINSGTLAAQGDLALAGASLSSTGALGAGIDASGKVTGAGSLTVNVTGAARSSGQNSAGADMAWSGASLSLAGSSTTASGNLVLTAQGGNPATANVDLSGSLVQAGGALQVNASGALLNVNGQASASQVSITAGSLANQGGSLAQSGSGTTLLAVSGLIDNTDGTLASNGGQLSIQSGALTNTGGQINHAGNGIFSIQTGDLVNDHGQLASNGQIRITAASLFNTGGRLSSAGSASLDASGAVTNTLGVIQAGTDLALQADSLSNSGGLAANGALTVTVAHAWDNTGGTLAAGTTLTATAASVSNGHGSLSAPSVAVTAVQVDNSGGAISADSLSLTAGQLVNQGGQVTQLGQGPITLAVSGTLDNSNGGLIQSNSTSMTLAPAVLDNSGGTIAHAGTGVFSLLVSGALDNQGGSIASNGQAQLSAATLQNQGGTLSSTLGLAVTAQSLDNDGGSLQNLGQAQLSLNITQALQNGTAQGRSGFIASNGQISLTAGALDNSGGTVYAAQDLLVRSGGSVTNLGGTLQSTASVDIGAVGAVANKAGQIEAGSAGASASTLALSGASIDNTGGRVANTGTGASTLTSLGQILNQNPGGLAGMGTIGGNGQVTLAAATLANNQGGQVIAGQDLVLAIDTAVNNGGGSLYAQGHLVLDRSTAALGNVGGSIGAAGLITLAVSSLDNTGGQIGTTQGSGGSAAITVTGALANQGGQIGADLDLTLAAGTLTGEGTIIGGRDASVALQGDYQNTSGNQIMANRDLTLSVAGTLTNTGNLEAARAITIQAANVANQGSGLINGQQTTVLAAGALTNTGRIYGDEVALAAAQFSNTAAGGQAGVVAARATLNIGADQVTNDSGAWLYSEGDLAIGAMLDAQRKATGTASAITNSGASIQTDTGDIYLNAQVIANLNPGFSTAQVQTGQDSLCLVQPSGSTTQYNSADIPRVGGADNVGDSLQLPDGTVANDYTLLTFTRTTTSTVVTGSTPGQILSGGNLFITGSTLTNDKSQIIAGASLVANLQNAVNNIDGTGQTVVTDVGTSNYTSTSWHGKDGRSRDWTGDTAYAPAPTVTPTQLGLVVTEQNVAPTSHTNQAAGQTVTSSAVPTVATGTLAQNSASQTPSGGSVANASGSTGGTPASGIQTVGSANAPIPNLALPNSRLYQINTAPGQHCLVETDPAFTSYTNFISSDYMLNRLTLDPQVTQLRLGDGFYEEQLVSSQIHQLTGLSYLQGQTSAAGEYKALMDNGVAYANQFNLEPGLALTAAQMAALTSDIVWMVQQTVTLASGQSEKVLVPVVYLSRTTAADLQPTGAVISAENLSLTTNGTLQNAGTLLARTSLVVTGNDIANSGRIAAASSGGSVTLVASHDFVDQGGTVSAQRVAVVAGNDLTFQTTTLDTLGRTGTATQISRVASISADQLTLQAGRDLTLGGAQVQTTGDASLAAGRNLDLSAVTTRTGQRLDFNAGNHIYQSQSTVVGTTVSSGGNLTLAAGQDLTATAAYLNATQAISATAGGSVTLTSADQQSHYDQATAHTSHGLFSSSSTSSRLVEDSQTAMGTTVSGDTVTIQAGKDILVSSSNVAGTHDVSLSAVQDVTIEAATSSQTVSSYNHTRDSGLMSGGSFGFSIGEREETDKFDQTLTTQSQNRSLVGSTSGNLSIVAGGHAQVSGSDLVAGLNLDLIAQSVTIDPGLDQSQTHQSQDIKQSGLTVALSAPVLGAAQTVTTMATTATRSKDGRVQALAAATAGLAAYNGAQALATSASTGGGVSVSATYGSSQSHSESSEASSTLSGSQVRAGGDLTIVATGGGTASDLTVIGSSLAAGHNLTLAADHAILLESGQNTDTSSSQSSSSGWGVGAAATYGSKGIAVGFTANASKSRGTGNGSDLSNVDTTVTAGNLLSLSSGGDTSLLGALLSGQQVVAAVGGDLTLASRQDTSTYHSDNQSLGGSLTVGAGVAGSVNYSKEKIASNYASVTEQTGIHAGDGGFQISVQGNTGLQGAVITSSDAAVANNKNTLSTGTLTVSDLQNHSDYNATSVSLSAGGGKSMGSAATGSGVHLAAVQTGVSGGAMAMSASGSDSSTTLSGISGGALTIGNGAKQQALTGQTAEAAVVGVNRAVSTGKDGTNRVANTFDLDDIETGFAVTRAFGQEVGTFVAAKAANAAQLKAALDQELLNVNKDPNLVKQLTDELSEAATWAQGGTSRQVLTALAAAASGNITGSGLQMVQGALVNFVQQQGASFIGDLVHGSNGQLGIIKEGSPEQAALQAIVAAGGSLAMGQDPLSGAAGAAASSLLTNLFKVDPDMSQADKDAQRNLMLTLVTGMAAGLGGDATSANASAFAALDDNAQSTKNSTKKAIAAGNAAQSNQTWVDPILNQTNPYWTQTKQLATDIAGLNPLINGVMLAKSIKDGNFSNFSSNFIGSTPELGTIWSGINVAGDVVGFGGIFIRDSIIVPMVTNDSRGPQAVDVNGHYNQFYDEASPSSW